MTAFWVCWAIVLACASLAAPWGEWFRGLGDSAERTIRWVWEALVLGWQFLMVLPHRYRPKTYLHTGRHRRSDDLEVDRWLGADNNWADTLHDMNATMPGMNIQATR